MAAVFYTGIFIASLICSLIYVYIWHKHFDVNFTMIFTIIPVACMGYVLRGYATRMDGAIAATQVIYIGGCFLQFFILFSIFSLCKIKVNKWIRTGMFVLCAFMYCSVLTIGHMDVFYSDTSFEMVDGVPVLTREYGFMHTAFYAVVIAYFLAGMVTIAYSLISKKQIPRRIICLIVIPYILSMFSFFGGKLIGYKMELTPLAFLIAEIIYVLIAYRVNLYDVSDTLIDSMVQERSIGYVSFDFNYRYLGSNSMARQLIPELSEMAVDEMFGYKTSQRKIRHYLDNFKNDDINNTYLYTVADPEGDPDKDRYYNVVVNYLYDGDIRRGYIVTFTDDTENRKYIRLIDKYNEQLQQEVDEKTAHIVEMHDNLILSLATMVESRDNSTGGHIKRTSEGVRILIDEILKEGRLSLTQEFCMDVIKAAPMHDLGKIAVDDAVLRKPGRFTDEEFEKMKHHAAEGARVIHEILLHTDDESFKKVAENVAHYHHERWNGTGYPEGLSGEEIPIEARIMAIADVYDALVSRRVYKDAFSYEKADRIIMEGMGTQFDPELESVYVKARPRLERYYTSL